MYKTVIEQNITQSRYLNKEKKNHSLMTKFCLKHQKTITESRKMGHKQKRKGMTELANIGVSRHTAK
jgi:hypothetical protein